MNLLLIGVIVGLVLAVISIYGLLVKERAKSKGLEIELRGTQFALNMATGWMETVRSYELPTVSESADALLSRIDLLRKESA